jgi:hypothetical protein
LITYSLVVLTRFPTIINLVPSTNYNTVLSYRIKLMDNTFISHIIGTVGFTMIEYFGEYLLEDKITGEEYRVPAKHALGNTYNIVQVVHGRCFTRPGLLHTLLRPHELRNFYNENVICHNGRARRIPVVNTPTYERDRIRYRSN